LLFSASAASRNRASRFASADRSAAIAWSRLDAGPVLGGGAWAITARTSASTVSRAWQQGQATSKLFGLALLMAAVVPRTRLRRKPPRTITAMV
jgi:hypothetical protein